MRRPHSCLWKDLTLSDAETLEGAESVEDVRRALHRLLPPEENVCPLRASALLDLYYYAVRFCQDNGFSRAQMSCLLSIMKETHGVCVETSLGNVDECYQYFKQLLLCHAVHRPPFSVAVFTQQQLLHISDYVLNTYFRHFKLYKYVFTPQVCLDLTISYDEKSESPEQEIGKNTITEEDMSSPRRENKRETEQQDQSVGGPQQEHPDQLPNQEVKDTSKVELQDNVEGRAEAKKRSPEGGTEGKVETKTRSHGEGTEGRAETRTRSPGEGTEGRDETRTRSPGEGTETRTGSSERKAETGNRSPGGGTQGRKGSVKGSMK